MNLTMMLDPTTHIHLGYSLPSKEWWLTFVASDQAAWVGSLGNWFAGIASFAAVITTLTISKRDFIYREREESQIADVALRFIRSDVSELISHLAGLFPKLEKLPSQLQASNKNHHGILTEIDDLAMQA